MSLLRVLRALGPIDLRSVGRDDLLAWAVTLPLMTALILRLGVPPLTRVLWARLGFDLVPYYPLILGYLVIMTFPATFGVIVGFLLLDEHDDGTLTALQVTPLPMSIYAAYRVAVPTLLTVLVMLPAFPIAGLGHPGLGAVLLAALTAAPLAPLFALALACFAKNKVEGFALIKALGFATFVPVIVSYFVRPPTQWAFALVPTFWPMKVYWALEAGDPLVWAYVLAGLAYQALLLALLLRRLRAVYG